MILDLERRWGKHPGWFGTLTEAQQATLLADLDLQAKDANLRALRQRARSPKGLPRIRGRGRSGA